MNTDRERKWLCNARVEVNRSKNVLSPATELKCDRLLQAEASQQAPIYADTERHVDARLSCNERHDEVPEVCRKLRRRPGVIQSELADGVNELLAAYLREGDPQRADQLLGQIICDYAIAVIDSVIGGKLGRFAAGKDNVWQDLPELRNTAAERLTRRLLQLRHGGSVSVITDFRAYAARTTENICNEYLRGKASERHRFKNAVRYICSHHTYFELWTDDEHRLVCGLAGWNGRPAVSLKPLCQSETSLVAELAHPHLSVSDRIEILKALFCAVCGPVLLDELVSFAAAQAGLQEIRFETGKPDVNTGDVVTPLEMVVDLRPAPDDVLAQRDCLQRLLREICLLPVDQRCSLLLNLRGAEGGDIRLLEWLGIAAIGEIARMLEWEPERLASIWNDLPVEDARIAQELGCTRQQVINLRNSARKRLGRRMRQWN